MVISIVHQLHSFSHGWKRLRPLELKGVGSCCRLCQMCSNSCYPWVAENWTTHSIQGLKNWLHSTSLLRPTPLPPKYFSTSPLYNKESCSIYAYKSSIPRLWIWVPTTFLLFQVMHQSFRRMHLFTVLVCNARIEQGFAGVFTHGGSGMKKSCESSSW